MLGNAMKMLLPMTGAAWGKRLLSRTAGFTLVELLVALAITSILVPVITSSMFQITRGTDSNNTKNVALADIDTVTSWMSRDLAQARTTDLIDCDTGTQSTVRVDWVDETAWAGESPEHYSNYYINPGTTHLIRDYDGSLSTIGRHVTSIEVCQVVATGIIELNVATTATGASTSTKTLYFYVTPRPEA